LTSGRDQTLRLWDVATGRELAMFSGPQAPVPVMAATKDDKVVVWAAAQQAPEILIIDPASGDKVKSVMVHERALSSLSLSADGSVAVMSDRSGAVRAWNLASSERLGGDLPAHKSVTEVAISNDQKTLVTGGEDGEIKIWDFAARKLVRAFRGHGERVASISLSADGKRFVSAGGDNVVKLWDAATGKELRAWKGLSVSSLLFGPDGKSALTANTNTTLYLLDCSVK
jgi:WD40 repeat protein